MGLGSGPLTIELRCPQCGTGARSDTAARTLTCAACGSLLLFAWSAREAFFVQDGTLDAAQLGDTLARADPHGRASRILDAQRFQVPHWYEWSTRVQAAPGRAQGQVRRLHMRSAPSAHTIAAYSGHPQLARRRGEASLDGTALRPLEPAACQALGPFLPWESVPERTREKLDRQAAQPLEPSLNTVERLSADVYSRRAVVYRPHWLAHTIGAAGQAHLLVDAVDGELLGRPGPLEARALLEALQPDPQAFGQGDRALLARPSNCPECGAGQGFDARAAIQVCDSCGRGMAIEADGLRHVPWAHAAWGPADLDGLWLPFWTFRLRLASSGRAPVETLEDWSRLAFPEGPPAGFEPHGSLLWLPAFPMLADGQSERAFRDLMVHLHAAPPEVEAGGFPPGAVAELVPATLTAPEARELGSFALLCLLDGAALARSGPSVLRRAVLGATLGLSHPRLTLLAFERRGEGAGLPGSKLTLPRASWRRTY